MGTVDIIIRVLIAVIIAILYYTHIINGTLAIILLVVAAIFLLTSLFGFCPLYTLGGINTNKNKE